MSSSPSASTPPGPGRTLVLCFDGTGNLYDATNTNVVKLFSLLKKDNRDEQLVYYQAGIGTYSAPSVMAGVELWVAKIMDEAFAWYLDAHVMGGYEFLMQNYLTGDRICLFGFSRGAYTARALAGMLYKVGLLPRDNTEQVGFAYSMYKGTGASNTTLAQGFKQTFSRSVSIEFMGCWDTVSSVGVFWARHLPFTSSSSIIKTFRHALSLDERRAKFQPNTWHREAPDSAAASKDPEHASAVSRLRSGLKRKSTSKDSTEKRKSTSNEKRKSTTKGPADVDLEKASTTSSDLSDAPGPPTDVLEVWFAGCHSDVGGGETPSSAPRSLANISLRWMLREIVRARCGIAFDAAALERAGVPLGMVGVDATVLEAQAAAADTKIGTDAAGLGELKAKTNGIDADADAGKAHAESSVVVHPVESPLLESPTLGTAPQTEPTLNGTSTTAPQSDASPAVPAPAPAPAEPKAQTQTKRARLAFWRGRARSGTKTKTNGTTTNKARAPTLPPYGGAAAADDALDALEPLHDELVLTPIWWVLEVIPFFVAWQDAEGVWHRSFRWNLGRGRDICDASPNVHATVQQRMAAPSMAYVPKATWGDKPSATWVV